MYLNSLCLAFFFSLACSFSGRAQPFTALPANVKKVKSITEWFRTDLNAESQRGGTSLFNKQGKLVRYLPARDNYDHQRYYYDQKDRLIRFVEGSETDSIVTRIAIHKNSVSREQYFRGKIHRTITFYKKGKKVEEKSFAKGMELGSRYLLKNRVVYTYNANDSLVGEMHYEYPVRGRGATQKRKVLHKYDESSQKRVCTLSYDYDGKLRVETLFAYDAKGRITKILHTYKKDGNQRLIEYKYKNNHIWQIIDDAQYKKVVSVFVDGRLIRNRSYLGGELFAIVDYQYAYYP